ncbi:TetR/AcrR family transcriptional regulator [uncultured Porticoccus sp.]|uniref:TetR/AcrR family transcriptional regulator n=1 Tax=uncultured Porticoccus sp. TaxID=1256050 RepID=UPI002619876C|nr:TetR/AcrR family transcriptional regulator [uncultured Porticoccus sp.]
MNLGRPREFDIDRTLESATRQFWAVGYEATSLQDLLRVMHLSKSSLYQTFGNKQQLFIQCLDHYRQSMVVQLEEKLAANNSAKGFLREFLEDIVAEAQQKTGRKGCLLVNTASELCQRIPEVQLAVAEGAGAVLKVFRRAMELAVEQGDIASSASLESLVNFYFSGASGLRTMVKAGVDKHDLEPVVALIMDTIK